MAKPSKEFLVTEQSTGREYVLSLFDVIASQDIFEIAEANLSKIENSDYRPTGWTEEYYSKKRIANDDSKENRYIKAEKAIISSEIAFYKLLSESLGTVGSWIVMSHLHLVFESEGQKESLLLLETGEENLYESYKIDKNEYRTGFDVSPKQIKERLDDFIFICWMMFYFHKNKISVVDFKLANVLRTKKGKQPTSLLFKDLAFIDFFYQGELYEKAMSKVGIRSTARFLPSKNPTPHNHEGYKNISLDVYALIVAFRQMITGVQALEKVTKGNGSEKHSADINEDLRVNKGISIFLREVSGFDHVDPIEKLSSYFLKYFNLESFLEIDTQVSAQVGVPNELAIDVIARNIAALFGVNVVQDFKNDEKPWHIEWSSEQLAQLEQAEHVYEKAKSKSKPEQHGFKATAVRVNSEEKEEKLLGRLRSKVRKLWKK